MVKLFALTILYKGPTSATALKSAYDVDSFSYFQRSSVREFMTFVSKTIVERTQIAARQSVKEGGNKIKFIDIFHKPYFEKIIMFFNLQITCAMFM